MDPVDEGARVEQVGLAGAGTAAADVDAGHGSLRRRDHDGHARQPSLARPLGLSDPDPGHVGDRVVHGFIVP